ncbi:MAG TPA: hypothetical protein VL492_06825 [Methylovirgula sp.]|jgi:hypothetical protein|nr:hypothetical protein [Methylovirgula sp.]
MKRFSALPLSFALIGLFTTSPFVVNEASAADLGAAPVHAVAHRPLPTEECYIWGYYGWREPYCGAMGGYYYQWGASYYLAPRHWGRNLFRYSYGYPY